MDFGGLRTLALETNFAVHGFDVTVERPNEDEIETRGIWLVPISEALSAGMDFQRREPIRVIALRRDEVPTVPRGTRITAPEKIGDTDSKVWIVDGFERQEADHHRVIVVRDPNDEMADE